MFKSCNGWQMITGLTTTVAMACAHPAPHAESRRVQFNDMFDDARTVALTTPADDPLRFATSGLVAGSEIAIVDGPGAEVKVFSRADGTLRRTIGKAGDDAGDFRHPTDIAPIDSGRFIILDQTRRVFSIRDSLGGLIEESKPLKGFFNGMVVLPGEKRVVLSGFTLAQTGDAKDADLHEYDLGGRRERSYAHKNAPGSKWADRLGTVFSAKLGDEIITGAMNSNRLRFYDRATGHTRWMTVAPDWYHEPEWPSDRLLQRKASMQTISQRITTFMHSQILMNGVFPLGGDRLLVRFMAFTSPQDKAFYYAVADSTGRTYAVSRATRAHVVATRADTVFWVHPGEAGKARLGTGVLDLHRLVL